jgi:putative membrane protein
MIQESKTLETVDFNPKIKAYLLISIALILTVTIIGIPFIIIWFLGLGQYYCKRYYENLVCTLTERHLNFKKGVMFKVEKTIPLENIQDLTFLENPLLKAFNLRILKIETAGQSNPQGSDLKLIGILDTLEFKNRVLRQRELLSTAVLKPPETNKSSQDQVLNELKEIKNLLREIRDK